MKRFERIKCEGCKSTIAFKIEDKIELKCRNCGKINIIHKLLDYIEKEVPVLNNT